MPESSDIKTQYAWQGTIDGHVLRIVLGTAKSGRCARMYLDDEQVASSTGRFRLADLAANVKSKGGTVPVAATFRYGSAFVNDAAEKCRVTWGGVVVPLQVLEAPWISTHSALVRWSALLVPLAGILAVEEFIPLLSSSGVRVIAPVLAVMLIASIPYRAPQAQRS